ncbi:hypothetical protein K5V07_00510 [Flavobacterium sp. CHNK8]|uniref:nucleic acid/nucleotide deaminase domain-containing protein n=1 Tax=Flavobacterium sp. CHNK8 TaxID=2871165 RepID=UPI001C8F0790|nr:nucleic acid/nucleotide deaminase domain-containing protein [Flavobacterium sp. CHNK8]QZK89052.1 hypothetical protein K5V07_00510 [Flavobacterium sp. CHNK8]
MKKIITIFLVLHSLFSFAQCQLNLLAGDLSKSNKEFKEIVNEASGFNAWQILEVEATALRTDINELTLVSKNLEAIKSAGGYMRWKAMQGVGKVLNKVVLGSEELSQIAVNFRKTLAVPNHKGNVAVFEYFDNSGNLVKKAFSTAESGPSKGIHSERIAYEFFVTNNIPKTNIKRVYSELEPCELASQCKQLLQTEYKQATISYSYPGGVDNTIRVNSVNQRFLDLENLLK